MTPIICELIDKLPDYHASDAPAFREMWLDAFSRLFEKVVGRPRKPMSKTTAKHEQDIRDRLANPGAELVLKRVGSEWFAADVFYPGMDPEDEDTEVSIPAARRMVKSGAVVPILRGDLAQYVSRLGQKSIYRHNYALPK